MVDRGKSGWYRLEREEARKGTVKTRKEERGERERGKLLWGKLESGSGVLKIRNKRVRKRRVNDYL
jgi:hypothetical protein